MDTNFSPNDNDTLSNWLLPERNKKVTSNMMLWQKNYYIELCGNICCYSPDCGNIFCNSCDISLTKLPPLVRYQCFECQISPSKERLEFYI